MSHELRDNSRQHGIVHETVGCCPKCFGERRLKSIIGRRGQSGECEYCLSSDVKVVDPADLRDFFEPLITPYQVVEEGTHYIAALEEEADGQPLDELLDEDNPGLFSDRLPRDGRQKLVQRLIDAIDGYDPREGSSRSVGELWTRPGNEIWAGAEEEFFRSAPARWTRFVAEITRSRRFVRESPPLDHDPASWLTEGALLALTRRLSVTATLYRAVIGGFRNDEDELEPLSAERVAGPRPEHCRSGGRVNPPGIPVLYTSTSLTTAIAEVRPWMGGAVTVARMHPTRSLRVVDLSPRRTIKSDQLTPEVLDVIETVGARMAEPVDPANGEIDYVPTQYVAELIKIAGYDGVRVKSALGAGRNVILFDTGFASIADRHLYRVDRIGYRVSRRDPEHEIGF